MASTINFMPRMEDDIIEGLVDEIMGQIIGGENPVGTHPGDNRARFTNFLRALPRGVVATVEFDCIALFMPLEVDGHEFKISTSQRFGPILSSANQEELADWAVRELCGVLGRGCLHFITEGRKIAPF